MGKPTNLKDLLAGGHINKSEVRKIARSIFDGETTAAGPEGYVITAVNFDNLPEHVQGFVVKAILEFKVENVFDNRASVHPVPGTDVDSPTYPDPAED